MGMMEMGAGMILGGIILQVLAFAVFMWVLYLVIRSGVRDGINQSKQLGQQPADRPRARSEPTF
ncbi:hypothetical protein [Ramlibacter rhizophilus]|uniref:Uncharacterized protein n=1 Tax=Ramlibacter rhizophilus TaxID=1781167 RepID=A0A4Z0BDY0_9BURK|nr:hypothetical protein [Ramlibacter rhizophilus]TFY97516.1 hypothetical protein EZ242_18535 [Ramlibacter rhizophilus]